MKPSSRNNRRKRSSDDGGNDTKRRCPLRRLLDFRNPSDGIMSSTSTVNPALSGSPADKKRSHGSWSSKMAGSSSGRSSENQLVRGSKVCDRRSMFVQHDTEVPASVSYRSHMTRGTGHGSQASAVTMSDMLVGIGQHVSISNMSLPRAARRRASVPIGVLRWRFDVGDAVRMELAQSRRCTEPEPYLSRIMSYRRHHSFADWLD